MNIRTRSAPTVRHEARPQVERAAANLLALALAGAVLAGCTSGQARESRRDEARDAGLQQQLAAEQATWTAQRYFPATETPSPPEPPVPALTTLGITFGFLPDGTPDGSYASVPAGAGTAYAAAQLAGVSAGQVVRAVVTDAWGNEIATPEVTIDAGAANRWVALPIPLPGSVAPGEYGVFVFADGHAIGSLAFAITSPGSAAQLLPPLPTNPQVRSTIGAPGAAPVQQTPTVAPPA
jgi:hypothetical protein